MKKKIIIVMNNLNCGGAEKALISLLDTIDYANFEIDLLLFKHQGFFLSQLNPKVNLLEEPSGYGYFDMSLKHAILDCLKRRKLNTALSRIKAGIIFKTEKEPARKEQRAWKYLSNTLPKLEKQYDIAIGFLEKNPIYFCIEKIKAAKKIGFIHNDYEKLGMDSNLDLAYFKALDYIVTVSQECANVLKKKFPMFVPKIKVIKNIISPDVIRRLSNQDLKINNKNNKKIRIVSVGRLNYQKGFDLAIKASEQLHKSGYNFIWYVLGEGSERDKLEKLIADKNLQDVFKLVGLKENPYPYIKQADIYVQPSRFEGKSIAIDEAKILQKPIVVTNFSTVSDQIIDKINGLVVNMDPVSIFLGVKQLIDNRELRKGLIYNLSNEKMGTENEINKLYNLIS